MGKKNNLNILTEQILYDLKLKNFEILQSVAEDITFEIESAYEKAIDAFYSHKAFRIPGGGYTNVPRIYNRTFNTYLASNRFGGTRTNEEINDYFEGKRNSKLQPFKDSYYYDKKSHKTKKKDRPAIGASTIKTNSKYEILGGILVNSKYMNADWYPYVNADWVFRRTYEQGIHGYHRYLNSDKRAKSNTESSEWFGRPPLIMSPTPEKIMRGSYWHIGSQRHINELISKYMKQLV